MAKTQKIQPMVYKILYRKPTIEQHELPLKTRGVLRCSEAIGSVSSISGTRCVTLVINSVLSHGLYFLLFLFADYNE